MSPGRWSLVVCGISALVCMGLIAGCGATPAPTTGTTTGTTTISTKPLPPGAPVSTIPVKGKRVSVLVAGTVGNQYLSVFTPKGWTYKGRDKENLSSAVFSHNWGNNCSTYFTVGATGSIEPQGQPLHYTLVPRRATLYSKLVLAPSLNSDQLLTDQVELIGHNYHSGIPHIQAGTSNIIITIASPRPTFHVTCPKNERALTETAIDEFANATYVDRFNGIAGPTKASGHQLSTNIDTTNYNLP